MLSRGMLQAESNFIEIDDSKVLLRLIWIKIFLIFLFLICETDTNPFILSLIIFIMLCVLQKSARIKHSLKYSVYIKYIRVYVSRLRTIKSIIVIECSVFFFYIFYRSSYQSAVVGTFCLWRSNVNNIMKINLFLNGKLLILKPR